ncbi:MAG TPA: GNAT family N-acetyltransferase [Gemmatimonadaceae bacterium]|nr:GNAT family N-acetyltransferase [Gemmatimonadaceae bacterium]
MPGSSVAVRAVTPADAEAVAALLTELGHPTDAVDVPARLESLLAEGGAAFVAVDGANHALGFISVARHAVVHAAGPVALITALVITGAARRRGAGRTLVAAAREWARRAGCARLSVTSGEHRADAHAFYQACGLPYTGRRFSTPLEPEP